MATSEGPLKDVEIIQNALGRLVKSESLTFTEAFEINAALRTKIRPGLLILPDLISHQNPAISFLSDGHVHVNHTRPTPSYTGIASTGGEGMVTDFDSDVQGMVDYESMNKEAWVRDWIEGLEVAANAVLHGTEPIDNGPVDTRLVDIPMVGTVPVVTEPGEIHPAKKDLVWHKTEEQDPYDRLDLFCETRNLSKDNEQDPYSSLGLFSHQFETPTVKIKGEDNMTNYNVSAIGSPYERKLPQSTKFEVRYETPENKIRVGFNAGRSDDVEKSVHKYNADSVLLNNREQSHRSSDSQAHHQAWIG